MARIRFPDEIDPEESIEIGAMAALKAMGHAAPIGYDGMCSICGALNCTTLFLATRMDVVTGQDRKVVIGCNKCLEQVSPFDWFCDTMWDAIDMGREEYERRHQPKPEPPRETGKVIDSLALGCDPNLSNF